jgi:hypothetical protein
MPTISYKANQNCEAFYTNSSFKTHGFIALKDLSDEKEQSVRNDAFGM